MTFAWNTVPNGDSIGFILTHTSFFYIFQHPVKIVNSPFKLCFIQVGGPRSQDIVNFIYSLVRKLIESLSLCVRFVLYIINGLYSYSSLIELWPELWTTSLKVYDV